MIGIASLQGVAPGIVESIKVARGSPVPIEDIAPEAKQSDDGDEDSAHESGSDAYPERGDEYRNGSQPQAISGCRRPARHQSLLIGDLSRRDTKHQDTPTGRRMLLP